MTITLIGYARCSTDKQDLAAQKAALEKLGVAAERICTDYGLSGTSRSRPGLGRGLAAVRKGDTPVVPKLDRLAPSVPDARLIADVLVVRGVRLTRVPASPGNDRTWEAVGDMHWEHWPTCNFEGKLLLPFSAIWWNFSGQPHQTGVRRQRQDATDLA